MADPTAGEGARAAAPSGPRALLFVLLGAAYYAVYYVFFAQRLSEYFRDLLRHFTFFRRLF